MDKISTILTSKRVNLILSDNKASLLAKLPVDRSVYFIAPLHCQKKKMIIDQLKITYLFIVGPKNVIMKDLMKKLTVITLFLGLSMMAIANDVNPDIRITRVADAKKFSLELANIGPETAVISLYDADGVRLLTENTVKDSYGKLFNLDKLPVGDYELVITTALSDIVQPIELTFSGIEMDAKKRTVYFIPTILTNKTNQLDISYFRGKITSVEVAIYDTNNDLVFEEDIDHVIKVERRYNLASLPAGRYNVRVSTDYKTYYKDVVVK